MHKIDTPTATPSGEFTEGNPFTGVAPTIVSADWLNAVQRELLAVIEASGQAPSRSVSNQLLLAIQSLGAGGFARSDAGSLLLPRQGDRRVQVWTSQVGNWYAGQTTVRPHQGTASGGTGGAGSSASDNTATPNEYDTGVFPGHAWPYQVPSSQQTSTTTGTYPACSFGSGVNHYRGGILVPAGALTNGGEIEVVIAGDYTGLDSGRALEFVVEPNFDPTLPFDANRAAAFQSSSFGPVDASAVGLWVCKLRGRMLPRASTLWIMQWTSELLMARAGLAPILDERRTRLTLIDQAAVNYQEEFTLNVRYKTTTAGMTLGATVADNSAQGSTVSFLRASHFQVHYYPGSY